MRVAIVGPAHPYKGGGARHTTELAHRLRLAGHPTVVTSWRAQYPRALYPGRPFVQEAEGEPYPATRFPLAWYRPDGWWREGRRLGRTADLVVFVVLSPVQVPAYLGLRRGVGTGARTLALCHNVLPHERRPTDVALMRLLLRRVDAALVHSPQQWWLARGLIGEAGTRVGAEPLPPHLPETAPLPESDQVHRRLLFLGIVRPYKGVDVLLRALAAGPAEVRLTVAGEFWGDTAESLPRLAKELGIDARVEFRPGYVPASRLPALFAASDAVVLPYRAATATQNVALAHAHRRPVIATRAGTLADQVTDGVDGLLCPPDDEAGLAAALSRFYSPGTPQRLRAAVAPPDPDAAWRDYLAALLRLGGTPPAAHR